MKRLKGYSFKVGTQEVTLKQPFSPAQASYDEMLFTTSIDNQLCKVFEMELETSQARFKKEMSVLEAFANEEFVTFSHQSQFTFKKVQYGLLLFERIRKFSLLTDEMNQDYKEADLLQIAKSILEFLRILQLNEMTLLTISPERLVSSTQKGKILPIDYSLMLDKSTDQNTLSNDPVYRNLFDSSFKYRSPEILNSFGKEQINWRSDMFSLGCLLHTLAYKSYPFQSSLAVINLSHQKLDDTKFNFKTVNKLIESCLSEYNRRVPASQLLKLINETPCPVSPNGNKQNHKGRSIFDQLKNAITIMTTQSQKWIVTYIEPNGKAPDDEMVTFLLNKVYKNPNKLEKIYSLVQKHTLENITSVQSMSKVLCLLWNFVRRGPLVVIDDYTQNINSIIKTMQKHKADHILQQIAMILELKLIITDEFRHIFQGNFCLLQLQKIEDINSNTLISLLDYLKNVLETYKKLSQPQPYIDTIFFDEMYDLCCSLTLIYLCITKDIALQKRRSEDKLALVEKELSRLLQSISKLPKAQLHLIASLDTLENYKNFLDFQAVDGIKVSVFQLFYKTNVVYHNLKLPISFNSLNKNTNIGPIDIDDDEDYEAKQERHIDNLILSKSKDKDKEKDKDKDNRTGSADCDLKSKSNQKTRNDFNVEWGVKKPDNQFDNVFGKQLAKSSFANLEFSQPKPRQKTMIESFLHLEKVTDPIMTSKNLALSNQDLFDFDFPTIKVTERSHKVVVVEQPPKLVMNFDFLNPQSVPKSQPQLQKVCPLLEDVLLSLKDEGLKTLIKAADIVVDFDKLTLNKVIGCGNAGEVYQGSYNSKTVAIKKIKSKQQNPNAHKEFQREITTLIAIGSQQRLNSLIGIAKKDHDFYLLMDYCAGGNLFELMHRRLDLDIPWKTRISIARQIAEGMLFLHSHCKIIHRDLKSLNVLVGQKYGSGKCVGQNIVVKITDFGLARKPDQFMTNALGTLHWMAPQLLEGRSYDLKVDVYSFGVVLWELCCRETPYQQFKSPHMIIKHVALSGGRPDMKSINPGCPEELKSLMTKCWSTNPEFRPVFESIVQLLNKIQA